MNMNNDKNDWQAIDLATSIIRKGDDIMAHQLPCTLQKQEDAVSEVTEQYLLGASIRQHQGVINDTQYKELGEPLIRQFVEYKVDSNTMNYRYDLALARLQGYYEHQILTAEELHVIWCEAIQAQRTDMQSNTSTNHTMLHEILAFGTAQEAEVLERMEASYLTL
jgi:hypothetical protein